MYGKGTGLRFLFFACKKGEKMKSKVYTQKVSLKNCKKILVKVSEKEEGKISVEILVSKNISLI